MQSKSHIIYRKFPSPRDSGCKGQSCQYSDWQIVRTQKFEKTGIWFESLPSHIHYRFWMFHFKTSHVQFLFKHACNKAIKILQFLVFHIWVNNILVLFASSNISKTIFLQPEISLTISGTVIVHTSDQIKSRSRSILM